MEQAVSATLRIGQVAAGAAVNVQTLRYYERRGLLAKPRRRPSGYREYAPDAIRVVRFIKRAQSLGFSLSDIQELIALRQNRASSLPRVRGLAAARVSDIADRVRRLQAMQRALQALIDACACDGTSPRCPIIEALEDVPDA